MSRWIYTLCNAVWSKSTHDHDDAAMCLPWTTVLCWPLARSFVNKELKTVHYMIHGETTLFLKREWASKRTNERMNEQDWWELNLVIDHEIHLCYLLHRQPECTLLWTIYQKDAQWALSINHCSYLLCIHWWPPIRHQLTQCPSCWWAHPMREKKSVSRSIYSRGTTVWFKRLSCPYQDQYIRLTTGQLCKHHSGLLATYKR